MKLHRVRIENVRQFRQPLHIEALQPGINLFSGPNEAGKSTIAQAIRAAFFERYRSKSVEDLRPWGDGSAAPHIEVEFSTDSHRYILEKTFLQRARCNLRIDGNAVDADEAEDRIADLLGFQYSLKGSSSPKHWGIPGLLWIEQGSGHEIQAQVSYATDHLRTALNSSLGEVVSAGGDDILLQVKKQRDELLTARGDARGDFKRITEERDAITQQLAELDLQITTYRQQVDQLGELQRQIAQDEMDKPWEAALAQKSVAAGQLARIEALLAEQQQARGQLDSLARQQKLMQERLAQFTQDQAQLQQRARQVESAQQRLVALEEQRQPLAARKATAEESYTAAHETLRLARQQEHRALLAKRLAESSQLLTGVQNRLQLAEKAQQSLIDLKQQAASCKIDTKHVEQLRQLHQKIQHQEIRLDSIATRISYALEPGKAVLLNQREIKESGELQLVEAAELQIDGIGRLTVTPGGNDLADLTRERDALREKFSALLQRLGVESIDVAEHRQAQQQQLATEIRNVESNLALHAPTGMAVLQAEQDELRSSIARQQTELDALAFDSVEPLVAVAEADVALEQARKGARDIDDEIGAHTVTLGRAQVELDSAQREHAALKARIDDATHQSRLQEVNRELKGVVESQQALEASVALRQRDIDAAQPSTLQQDVERFGRSANTLEQQYRSNTMQRERLLAQLGQAGAQGLEERRAELAVIQANTERRWQELSRRAKALDLLTGLLEQKRHALTQRLQAPLQKHLNHYLQLLFPGTVVELDETLTPSTLRRTGQDGGSFDALSFGTREQMALISRLAYADLLREAGKATLIMLDDALVHSDDIRLSQMKRILFDASQRHQILMFTCHPQRWRDLGVAARSVESLRTGGAE